MIFSVRQLPCIVLLISCAAAHGYSQQAGPTRIACLGASITYGSLLNNPVTESYPGQLQGTLGKRYEVKNYGVPGSTMVKKGDRPYHKTHEYQLALASNPNIVTIDLGGNDSKLINRIYLNEFEDDAREMIAAFRKLPSRPRIILLLPVPSFVTDTTGIWDPVIVRQVISRLRNVAFIEKVEVVDLHAILIDKPQWFPDHIHPDLEGTTLMARRLGPVILQERDVDFNLLPGIGITAAVKSFYGYDGHEFVWQGRDCKIVCPKVANKQHRWIWRARFWGHEPQVDVALLELGFYVVYCDVAELFGNKEAIGHWNDFYEMVTRGGLHAKAAFEGMSRGAVYVYNWAAEHPERVACVYVDNPLLDLMWWPARQLKSGTGNKSEWEIFKKDYNFSNDADALKSRVSPIDKIPQIVKGHYPMLHVCGDADEDVPMGLNTTPFAEKVRQLHGNIAVMVKPGFKHHPHSLPDPTPIVNFILASTKN